ncbi:hypothetical protein V8C35DRAFT_292155 [Trichoderma chlorosporum]
MQFSTLLTAVLAAAVSASEAADDSTQATGVTFFEHIYYSGHSFEVPSLNRCWTLPTTLAQKVSSVRFTSNGVSCALFRNRVCLPPVLYAGLRESVPDLHLIGLGDEIGSVYCGSVF